MVHENRKREKNTNKGLAFQGYVAPPLFLFNFDFICKFPSLSLSSLIAQSNEVFKGKTKSRVFNLNEKEIRWDKRDIIRSGLVHACVGWILHCVAWIFSRDFKSRDRICMRLEKIIQGMMGVGGGAT